MIRDNGRTPKQGGVVYFLGETGRRNPRIKIGRAKDLDNRLTKIRPALPTKTILLHDIGTDDCVRLENFFHTIFEQFRENGEWFDLPASAMLLCARITLCIKGRCVVGNGICWEPPYEVFDIYAELEDYYAHGMFRVPE